jgi:hypothetical protein
MSDIAALFNYPRHILYIYVALWALAALAHTMPAPDSKSSKGYQWAYNLLQFLLANLSKLQIAAPKPAEPGAKPSQG